MEDWQQRVVDEAKDLGGKLDRLTAFFNTEAFAKLEAEARSLMREQAVHMQGYLRTLQDRIERF